MMPEKKQPPKANELKSEKRLEQITEWMDNVQIRGDLAAERVLDELSAKRQAEKQKQHSCTEEQLEKGR